MEEERTNIIQGFSQSGEKRMGTEQQGQAVSKWRDTF